MDAIPIGQALLQKVVFKLGGALAAAERLGVKVGVLAHYLEGRAPVPDSMLLLAVDIVLGDLDGPPAFTSQLGERSFEVGNFRAMMPYGPSGTVSTPKNAH